MRRYAAAAIVLGIALAACGGPSAPASAGPPISSAAKPSAPASSPGSASAAAKAARPAAAGSAAAKPASSGAAAAKPAGSGAGGPAASGSGAPAASPTFVDGTVQALDATHLTLTGGGKVFAIAPNTGFTRLVKMSPSEVKAGQYVAITAKEQPDNTLLATFLRIQDSAAGRPANQFPMDAVVDGQPVTGNLMVNAPIESASGSGLVVALPGGDVTVKYAPDVQITHQEPGTASDVKAGSKVLIISRGGSALAVGLYA